MTAKTDEEIQNILENIHKEIKELKRTPALCPTCHKDLTHIEYVGLMCFNGECKDLGRFFKLVLVDLSDSERSKVAKEILDQLRCKTPNICEYECPNVCIVCILKQKYLPVTPEVKK